ncbi:hypothetical protein V6N12_068089 [Hibiscus sabdariffa]|uniref:RNase H type-1 domain-containing protein n=1 Tax=Hibiscus sabdariffa TaxID=183260 RepID=A0ABR2FP05_9ROSI
MHIVYARPIALSQWEAPPEAAVKINFDSASNFHARNVSDAFVTEALACKQAVHFAKDIGFLNVIIEEDSLTVSKKLNSVGHDSPGVSFFSNSMLLDRRVPPRTTVAVELDRRDLLSFQT